MTFDRVSRFSGPRLPRLGLLIVAGATLAWLAVRLRGIVAPFALAGLLAYLLESPVRRLAARGVPRGLAIAAVYMGAGAVVATLLLIVAPAVARELAGLGESLPGYVRQGQAWVARLRQGYLGIPLPESLRGAVDEGLAAAGGVGLALVSRSVSGTLSLIAMLPYLILVPVLAVYLSNDLSRVARAFYQLFPPATRPAVRRLMLDVDVALGGFLRGQATVAAIVGTLWTIGLSLLGVRFAVLLGLFGGLAEFIPYFGPFLAVVPAALLGLTVSGTMAVKVLVLFALIQQIETAVVAPRVMSGQIGIHPVLVIFSLLAAERLLGPAGLVIAVPAAAVLRVLGRHALEWIARSRPPSAGGH